MNNKIKKQYNCYCKQNHFYKFSTFSRLTAEIFCKDNNCYSPELICE